VWASNCEQNDVWRNNVSVFVVDEILEHLRLMPQNLQWQVLEFARSLLKAEAKGTPGQNLLRFAGSIPANDLQLMSEAIEQGCERIDADEW
jgi:hypothetical protein